MLAAATPTNGLQNLAAFAGRSRRDRERAEEALEELGLSRLADAIYTQTSGGERQHLRELYGVEVEVTEVSLADGARRRVCLTAGGR